MCSKETFGSFPRSDFFFLLLVPPLLHTHQPSTPKKKGGGLREAGTAKDRPHCKFCFQLKGFFSPLSSSFVPSFAAVTFPFKPRALFFFLGGASTYAMRESFPLPLSSPFFCCKTAVSRDSSSSFLALPSLLLPGLITHLIRHSSPEKRGQEDEGRGG